MDLIKTYRSKNRVSKVLTSSLFKRREDEANLAIDRAINRSNVSHVGDADHTFLPIDQSMGRVSIVELLS